MSTSRLFVRIRAIILAVVLTIGTNYALSLAAESDFGLADRSGGTQTVDMPRPSRSGGTQTVDMPRPSRSGGTQTVDMPRPSRSGGTQTVDMPRPGTVPTN